MNLSPFTSAVQTRELEARVAAVAMSIPNHGLGHIKAEAMLDYASRDLVLRLKAYVYGESLGTKTVRYPADWREAVKERFAPAWLLARYPVQYRTIELRAFASYPEFRPAQGAGPGGADLRDGGAGVNAEDWWKVAQLLMCCVLLVLGSTGFVL